MKQQEEIDLRDSARALASDAALPGHSTLTGPPAEVRALSNINQRVGGSRGGFVTSVLYGRSHYAVIAKKGWEPATRMKRIAKHQASIVKARAALKAIREAKKRLGPNWQYERWRETILQTKDPKATLRELLRGTAR